MKRKYLNVAVVIALSASFLSTSCIGRFQLTNKLLSWNQQVGNKFVNELVFFAFWILRFMKFPPSPTFWYLTASSSGAVQIPWLKAKK